MIEAIKLLWKYINEYMPFIIWAVAWILYFTVVMIKRNRKSGRMKGSWSETYSKKFKTKRR